jgi:hypothetical protein
MKESNTFTKNLKNKKARLPDWSVNSNNHSKSVRFRVRIQQGKEADEEIQEYVKHKPPLDRDI